MVPPGGLEPPPHGSRAQRAAFTLRREVELMPGSIRPAGSEFGRASMLEIALRSRGPDVGRARVGGCRCIRSALERMAGFEPAPQGLEGPQATVTPHSLWFGLRVSNPSLRAGDAGCIPHTQAEHGPVSLTGPWTFRQLSKTPLLRAGGQQGIRTRWLPHPLVPPVWRQRQDSNPDPRALEARMLPLHHAAVVPSRLDRFEDRTSPRPDAVFLPRVRPKQKGLLGDRPRRPGCL